MQMLHLGDSEDDEMEFSDVPLATAAPPSSSSSAAAAAPPSHSAGTRPRGHVSSEAVATADDAAAEDEAEEEGEESKPRTHHVSRLHCQSILPK